MAGILPHGFVDFPLVGHAWPRPHVVDHSDVDLLRRALESDDWSHAVIADEFQSEFAAYVGSRHALLVPSGTAAVYLALVAAGIRARQEVIIPGITWPSVAYSIIKAGGVPRTAEISADSLCMTADTIEPLISENTFAVMPTHLFGSQCDMREICALAESRDLVVIEDAAQSMGSRQDGRKAGTWGLAGTFSLNDRKLLACGEGGCIVTDDSDLFEELLRLQLILPDRSVRPSHLPGTYKVSEFQAAVALAQLRRLEAVLARIESNASLLTTLLESEGSIHPQTRPEACDFQSYYSYCFNVDGVADMRGFRAVLGEKLNLKVSPPYAPLCDVPDFDPLRGVSDEAFRNLSIRHPNCLRAYHERSARFPHHALRTGESEMRMIHATIARVRDLFRD